MAEDLTLGQMVHFKLIELYGRADLEAGSELTGISERHLRRIVEDEGFSPNSATANKLERLGLNRNQIMLGAYRAKMKAMEARLVASA